MKRILVWALLAAALCLPDRGTDIGKLLPVELVAVRREEGVFRVETDTGQFGLGNTLEEAMADLRNAAPGVVFFDTADYLLLTRETLTAEGLSSFFRPGVRVLLAEDPVDPEEAAEYLRSRKVGVQLKKLGEIGQILPELSEKNSRLELVNRPLSSRPGKQIKFAYRTRGSDYWSSGTFIKTEVLQMDRLHPGHLG